MAKVVDVCEDEFRISDAWKKVLVMSLAVVLRAAVSIHPYSGERTPPMYGDFEAQRHWMEIALNVPVGDWYRETAANNLTYWGLDYPPLSGYVSWLCGKFLWTVDPKAVELRTSWGYETEPARAAMRLTVIVTDLLVFFPILMVFNFRVVTFAALLPALVLMDHGHFQYNAVSLGLCVGALALYTKGRDVAAAVAFCGAVYFKHLCLYFALALLAHHVAQMGRKGVRGGVWYAVKVLGAIGGVTVVTFAPWITSWERMVEVGRRLFPVGRGIYEDKVANFWCSISVLVKVQRLWEKETLVLVCALVTVLFSLPFCAAMFGRRREEEFVLACAGCALAAFLFSFQVHEKQVLLPLVALALVHDSYPRMTLWMSMAASMSLFPLLVREGLVLPYIVVNTLHLAVVGTVWNEGEGKVEKTRVLQLLRKVECVVAFVGVVLHLVLLFGKAPDFAKDLFVLLVTGFSCAIFCAVYAAIVAELWGWPWVERRRAAL